MLKIWPVLAILFIGISVTTFNTAHGNQLTEITVTIIGDPLIVLNSQKNMIRANVEIENYDPGDGYYFMKVVDTSSGQILRESEILPMYAGNDIWSVQIAYLPQQDEIEIGEYEIQIITEYGSATGKISFSVTDEEPEPSKLETAGEQTITKESSPKSETSPQNTDEFLKKESSNYEKGLDSYQLGNYVEALTYFELAIKEEPENEDAKNHLTWSKERVELKDKCPVGGGPSSEKWFDLASKCCIVLAPPDKVYDCQMGIGYQKANWMRQNYGDPIERQLKETNERNKQLKEEGTQKRYDAIYQDILEISPYLGIGLAVIIAGIVVAVKKRKRNNIGAVAIDYTMNQTSEDESKEKIKWEGI